MTQDAQRAHVVEAALAASEMHRKHMVGMPDAPGQWIKDESVEEAGAGCKRRHCSHDHFAALGVVLHEAHALREGVAVEAARATHSSVECMQLAAQGGR
jgi:hypothetical protein